MFVNSQGSLALLEPKDYFDPSRYQAEQEGLRRRSWYWAGLRSDLARPNQYFARTVSGIPVIVWNQNGKLKAFKNVCLHRHSQVVKDGPGHGSVLRCQYHGWEYSGLGRLKHIPDAECFAGVAIPLNCLTEYSVEFLGDFVLVALESGVPSLRESLGELAAELDQFYCDRYLFHRQTVELNVNWKLVLENAVENYHVPFVHPTTFKNYYSAEVSQHTIESQYTSYKDLRPWTGELKGYFYLIIARILYGQKNPKRFAVTHVFPSLIFYYGDLLSVATYVECIGSERTLIHSHCYAPSKQKSALVLWPIHYLLRWMFKITFKTIFAEDNQVLLEVQAGLRHAEDRAVLSLREERIHGFHLFMKS
jgi:hypothetical protein